MDDGSAKVGWVSGYDLDACMKMTDRAQVQVMWFLLF
jgi:hypothetical protein